MPRKTPQPRPHDSEATREALVVAATDLFAEHGFEGVRVEQIAEASGVNKALINYHFGGKAGLYSSILRSTFGAEAKTIAAIQEADHAPDEKLRRLIRLIGDMVARRPSLPRMLLREVLSGGEHMDQETLPSFFALFGAVSAIVSEGIATGDFRKVDPFSTHLGLIGSLMFFFSTDKFREKLANSTLPLPPGFKEPDPKQYLKHIEELMLRGLAVDKPRRSRR